MADIVKQVANLRNKARQICTGSIAIGELLLRSTPIPLMAIWFGNVFGGTVGENKNSRCGRRIERS